LGGGVVGGRGGVVVIVGVGARGVVSGTVAFAVWARGWLGRRLWWLGQSSGGSGRWWVGGGVGL